MNRLFQVYSIFCIIVNIPTFLQAQNFNLDDDAEPDVNCLLFGNVACHATCALIGKLHAQGGEGSCDQSFTCACKLYQSASLDEIWKSKFVTNKQSTTLLNIFNKNQKSPAYKKAINALKNPLLTNAQIKELLIELLPKHKTLKQLQPISSDEPVEDFVKNELREIPENASQEIVRNNYKERMSQFIDAVDSNVTINFVVKQLEKVPDTPYVSQILKKLKQKSESSTDSDEEQDESDDDEDEDKEQQQQREKYDQIAAYVTKELINYSDKNPNASTKTVQKKNSKSTPSKSDSKKSNKTSSSNTKIDNTDSDSKWKPSVKVTTNTKDYLGNVVREWEGENSSIRYQKDQNGEVTVDWQSGDTTIHLTKSMLGDVNQSWTFGKVKITLNNDYMGNVDHKWNFGKTQYFYTKSYMGQKSSGWTDTEDSASLSKYQGYIKSWCAQNTELFTSKCGDFKY